MLSFSMHHAGTSAGVSATTVAVIAAVIGAGGSVLGGVIGGWLALVAGHRQSQRDRAATRMDQSHQAALAITESVASMDEAIVTWGADDDSAALRTAFNIFSRAVSVQSIALTEVALASRVRTHVLLTGRLAAITDQTSTSKALIPTVRRHTDAVIESLQAHFNDAPLPPYRAPSLDNAAALIAWARAPGPPPNPPPPPQQRRWLRRTDSPRRDQGR